MGDAGANVETPHAAIETNVLLWQHIQTPPLPIVMNADDVIPH
jgi:hypothetical protein